ncbi:MAG: hypothetical protein ACK5LN_03840 [Propioniciclava sp.]
MTARTGSAQWFEVAALIREANPLERAVRASSRLLQLAAGLGPNDRLSLVMAGMGAAGSPSGFSLKPNSQSSWVS